MKKALLSLVAAAAITASTGISAQAEEVVVEKGDTLSSLSRTYGVTVTDIKEWNGLTSDTIYVDQAITISPEEYYIVVPGDTLWSIAQKYGVTISELQAWNDLPSHMIYPDDKLLVKTNGKAPAEPASKGAAAETKPAAAKEKPKADMNPSVQEQSANTVNENTAKKAASKTMTVTATAYTAYCEGCSGVTAAGIDLKANPDAKVIAVDPSVIPLGTKVYVEGYGYATAADTGGAIKGNKIDVFIPTQSAALSWGKRQVEIQILQ